MSESRTATATTTRSDRSVFFHVGLVVFAAIVLRVWIISENLSNSVGGGLSATWTDRDGLSHTISLSPQPGQEWAVFAVEFRSKLDAQLVAYPKGPQ